MLAGKHVLVGVTGGIAAYKAAELVSMLTREGAETKVVMTDAATRFVAPLTFAALSGHPVTTSLFGEGYPGGALHIDLAKWADLMVIAPATANLVAKLAGGLADDPLSTIVLAARVPVLVCPAMNVNMYRHPAVQANLKKLADLGYHLMEPGVGRLSCGTYGEGRLPDPPAIVERLEALTVPPRDLAGYTILITAGATREPLDPVRFLSNRSSGKMGYALAKMAAERGGEVVLVSGPAEIPSPAGVRLISVQTADEMRKEVLRYFPGAHVVIKAAAVADFRPVEASAQKIKKGQERSFVLQLQANPDILKELGSLKEKQVLVGFSAETGDLLKNAALKMAAKNLDLMVANDVSEQGAGFGSDNNHVFLLFPDGRNKELPLMDKHLVADRILDEVGALLDERKGESKL